MHVFNSCLKILNAELQKEKEEEKKTIMLNSLHV